MKSKIIVACIVTAFIITFLSCDWLKSKDEPKQEVFNIEGQWVIDSVENKSRDSSKNMGIFLLALASTGEEKIGIEFNSDSTYHFINSSDSIRGNYYFSDDKNSLIVKEDSLTHQLNFLSKSDSLFTLSSTDSLVYYLRKK